MSTEREREREREKEQRMTSPRIAIMSHLYLSTHECSYHTACKSRFRLKLTAVPMLFNT